MRLTPNLNGTSKEALVEQRVEIGGAIRELLRALGDGWPNGRDYQLAPDLHGALRADTAEWEAFASSARDFLKRMEDEAYEIIQGEAGRP